MPHFYRIWRHGSYGLGVRLQCCEYALPCLELPHRSSSSSTCVARNNVLALATILESHVPRRTHHDVDWIDVREGRACVKRATRLCLQDLASNRCVAHFTITRWSANRSGVRLPRHDGTTRDRLSVPPLRSEIPSAGDALPLTSHDRCLRAREADRRLA